MKSPEVYALLPVISGLTVLYGIGNSGIIALMMLVCLTYLSVVIAQVSVLSLNKDEHDFKKDSTWRQSALSSLYTLFLLLGIVISSVLPPVGPLIVFRKIAMLLLKPFVFALMIYINTYTQIRFALFLD